MLSREERQKRVEARGAEYRAGVMSEEQFRAYLFSMNRRGEDIRHTMNEFAPPRPPQTFEERRMEISRQWIKDYQNEGR